MYRNNVIFISLVAVLYLLIESCKKDQLDSQELLAYIKPGNSKSLSILKTPIFTKAIDSVYTFTAFLTRPTSVDVTINVKADEAAVNTLNQQDTSKHYLLLPSSSYKISGSSAFVIPAGSATAMDSIKIQLVNYAALDASKNYVLPLSIMSINSKDRGVQSSSNFKTVYITTNFDYTAINQSTNSINGTLIDRSNPAWTVSASSPSFDETFYFAGNVLDGNNFTAWFADGQNAVNFITIDMGKINTVKGFSLTPNYIFGSYYNPTEIKIEVSNDKIKWTGLGTYKSPPIDGLSNESNPDIRNINFYGSFTFRYFRLTLTNNGATTYTGLAEIRAFN